MHGTAEAVRARHLEVQYDRSIGRVAGRGKINESKYLYSERADVQKRRSDNLKVR